MKIFLYKHLQGIKVLISAEIIIDEYVKYQFKILGVWSFVSMIPSKQKGSDRELIQSTLLILSRSRMDPYGTMSMAYRVYLSDYLPLDISTTTAYLSIGANQFALKIWKLFI